MKNNQHCNSCSPNKHSRKKPSDCSLAHLDNGVTENTPYNSTAVKNGPDAEMGANILNEN